MGLTLLLIIAFIAIVVYIQSSRRNSMLSEGKIVNRDGDFYEKAEIFKLRDDGIEGVVNQISRINMDGTASSFEGNRKTGVFNFTSSHGWRAVFRPRECEEEGKMCFEFRFTHWETYNSIPQGTLQMNQVLTLVERALLEVDPNTRVDSEYIKTKTKTKFF